VTVTRARVIFAGSSRGAAEGERLTRALLSLKARGLCAPCQDPVVGGWWLSDSEEERARAALRCGGCPVLVECGRAAVARRERFGVWSGKDYTRKPTRGAAG
jgi:hypothetical protein